MRLGLSEERERENGEESEKEWAAFKSFNRGNGRRGEVCPRFVRPRGFESPLVSLGLPPSLSHKDREIHVPIWENAVIHISTRTAEEGFFPYLLNHTTSIFLAAFNRLNRHFLRRLCSFFWLGLFAYS